MNILLNGVGRIGKSIFRIIETNPYLQIIAINELNTNIKNIAYSINYDSTYGSLEEKYNYNNTSIYKNSKTIQIYNLKLIDIDYSNIDIIIDASGDRVTTEILSKLPVKAIFLTHPNNQADINVILGVNQKELSCKHKIISTSSCNATALMPLLHFMDQSYTIVSGDIVTIHPFLNHQKVLDSNCVGSSDRDIECNFEFGRSSTQNIIPSKTTTIEACSYVNKKFNNTFMSSNSLRVPTSTVGVINVCLYLHKKIEIDEILEKLHQYEKSQDYPILKVSSEALVSSDFKKDRFTTIIDDRYLQVINKNQFKSVIWYDNEWGYASKVVQIVELYSNL